MWRAFFLAIGIFVVVLGGECLVVDRFVMAGDQQTSQPAPYGVAFQPQLDGAREVIPPEWAPWSMLSTGAVMILYSLTLNRSGGLTRRNDDPVVVLPATWTTTRKVSISSVSAQLLCWQLRLMQSVSAPSRKIGMRPRPITGSNSRGPTREVEPASILSLPPLQELVIIHAALAVSARRCAKCHFLGKESR